MRKSMTRKSGSTLPGHALVPVSKDATKKCAVKGGPGGPLLRLPHEDQYLRTSGG